MGVIRNLSSLGNNNNNFDDDFIEDIIDNIIDNNNDSEVENEIRFDGTHRSYRNRENRLRRNRLRPEPTFRALGLRGKSHKKSRRYANANLMSQHLDLDVSVGEELEDISIYDFIPQTVSVFAQLLIQKENIETFNELINCTEDQQNHLLDQINGNNRYQNKLSNTLNDCQTTKEQFSADQCFKRIDSELKNLLKKKRIPLGVLASIEEEITDFFNDKPSDIYKSCLSSGFQRLLLHACCQYLDLKCLSFDSKGERWTKVRNDNDYFAQPSVMLAKYLEARYNNC